ncbi:hypothetical protein RYX36_035926 [Vicia faba]
MTPKSKSEGISEGETEEMMLIEGKHFPKVVTKNFLYWNQRSIKLVDEDNRDKYFDESTVPRGKKGGEEE